MREAPVITVLTCGLLRGPGDGQLRQVQPSSAAIGSSCATAAFLAGSVRPLAQEGHVLQRAAAARRHAVRYLPVSRPAGQRAPGRQAQADVVVQPRVLLLDALAVEQVVLRLLHHRLVQVVALGDLPGGADVGRAPLAGAPVQRLALRDDVAHRPHRLLDRRVRVGAVAVDEVDVLQAEALQRAVDGLHQVLAVERVLAVDRIALAVQAPEELGRHHVVQPRPAQLLERLAHDLLAAAAGIASALSKKLMPASKAAAIISAAALTSTWCGR
jgi:hypothetical protein